MTKICKIRFEEMLLAGCTLEEMAGKFNTTRQNISLRRKAWFPHLTRQDFGCGLRTKLKVNNKVRLIMKHTDDTSRNKSLFFSRKKQNAKNSKWGFNLKFEDVIWNDVCPVFGVPIDWDNHVRGENSPSMDRIDSTKGYVPGNVAIISWRANRIKNDGSAEEHRKIASYIENENKEILL